ncbi:MAG TPA: LysR family transcriptional regulator [Acidimicrobiales bacterium]
MNAQQLRYVVATAELGTMTRAADACSVGQPALTRAIRALEQELCVTLFRRAGRRVEITDHGVEVVALARRALADLAAIEDYGHRVTGQTVLTVAATATIQSDLGSGLILDFWDRFPQHPVRFLRCDSDQGVSDAVADRRADAGISDVHSTGDLAQVVYERREVVLIAPPGSDLPDPLPFARLGDLPLVSTPTGTARRSAFDGSLAERKLEPRIAFESDERSTWIPAVLAGLGCCLWYRHQAEAAAELGAHVVSLDPPMSVAIAVLHRDEPLAAPVAGLVKLARERQSTDHTL